MIKYILSFILTLIIGSSFAQQQIDSSSVRKVFKLAGKRTVGISNDATATSKDTTKLITEGASKKYADNLNFQPAGSYLKQGGNTFGQSIEWGTTDSFPIWLKINNHTVFYWETDGSFGLYNGGFSVDGNGNTTARSLSGVNLNSGMVKAYGNELVNASTWIDFVPPIRKGLIRFEQKTEAAGNGFGDQYYDSARQHGFFAGMNMLNWAMHYKINWDSGYNHPLLTVMDLDSLGNVEFSGNIKGDTLNSQALSGWNSLAKIDSATGNLIPATVHVDYLTPSDITGFKLANDSTNIVSGFVTLWRNGLNVKYSDSTIKYLTPTQAAGIYFPSSSISLSTGQIAFCSGTNTITGSSAFLFDGVTNYGSQLQINLADVVSSNNQFYGLNSYVIWNPLTYNSNNQVSGFQAHMTKTGTVQAAAVYGANVIMSNTGTGNVNSFTGVNVYFKNASTGTIANAYGVYVQNANSSASNTITNSYGIYILPQLVTGVTKGVGIYQTGTSDFNYFAGNILSKTTTDDGVNALQVNGTAYFGSTSTTNAATGNTYGYNMQVRNLLTGFSNTENKFSNFNSYTSVNSASYNTNQNTSSINSTLIKTGSTNEANLMGVSSWVYNNGTATVDIFDIYAGSYTSLAAGNITSVFYYHAYAPTVTFGTVGTITGFYINALKVTNVTNAYAIDQKGSSDINRFYGTFRTYNTVTQTYDNTSLTGSAINLNSSTVQHDNSGGTGTYNYTNYAASYQTFGTTTVNSYSAFSSNLLTLSSGTLTYFYGFSNNSLTVTNSALGTYYGFYQPDVTGVTTVYGYRSLVTSGTNKWGLYMSSANNYFGTGNQLIGSAINNGVDVLQVTGSVISTQYKLSSLNTAPSSSTATGTLGEIRVTSSYIYICSATNTWVRAALSTF